MSVFQLFPPLGISVFVGDPARMRLARVVMRREVWCMVVVMTIAGDWRVEEGGCVGFGDSGERHNIIGGISTRQKRCLDPLAFASKTNYKIKTIFTILPSIALSPYSLSTKDQSLACSGRGRQGIRSGEGEGSEVRRRRCVEDVEMESPRTCFIECGKAKEPQIHCDLMIGIDGKMQFANITSLQSSKGDVGTGVEGIDNRNRDRSRGVCSGSLALAIQKADLGDLGWTTTLEVPLENIE
ncbi:hypothetical protein B0J14DRAFT_571185 [Halenospora varia]|nr:hypothetical protein B0J14DRAFT_571185 [Halenospora varia]